MSSKTKFISSQDNNKTISIKNISASKQNLVYIAIGLVLVIVLGFILSLTPVFKRQPNYVAVYLVTGDIYFGKLSRFPSLKLSDAVLLQIDQQNQLSLSRFDSAAWQPEGTIKLNQDKIVWIAPLAKNSQIIQIIEGNLPPQQTPPQPPSSIQPPEDSEDRTSPENSENQSLPESTE